MQNTTKDPIVDMHELKHKSVRGGMVTMFSQATSIVIQLTSTIVLARLLSPEDYGIIAMVTAVTAFAGLFRELGLSSATIQKRDLTHAQHSNLFWINVTMGVGLTILVALCAPIVAWFYGKPELIPVTRILSAIFFIGSLGTQHGAGLVREMQFGRRATATISGALVTLIVSIVLALNGFGYWALVWGSLSGAFTTSFLLFLVSPFRPSPPSLNTGLRDMLKFGANVTAFDFVNYFHRNSDNILIGRYWGTEILGIYSRAYSLLMLPISSIRGPINAVGMPALSQLQDNPEEFRNYYNNITRTVALASMPLMAFLFVSSKNIVIISLGAQWVSIIPIFSILATVGFIQPVITLWGLVLISRGMGSRYLRIGIFNTLCSVCGFLVGVRWGAIGVAIGYAIITYITCYPILRWAFRGTPLNFTDFIQSIYRPFTASIVAGVLTKSAVITLEPVSPFLGVLVTSFFFSLCFILMLVLLPNGKSDIKLILFFVRPLIKIYRSVRSTPPNP